MLTSKILIAEDDQFLANAYRVKFEKSNYTVKLVFDGEEALKEVISFKPDIILLDLVMPKKDGFVTLVELKSDPKTAKIPVVVTTNLSQESDIAKVKDLGAIDYLVKSDTSLQAIVEKITGYLK
ncbi:MAG: response regulator [bacterium]